MKTKSIIGTTVCMFISSLVLFSYSLHVDKKLDRIISENMPLDGENVISVVDTIYGRKYVVSLDTVTGYAEIVGFRHNPVMIEDPAPQLIKDYSEE